MNSFHTHYDTLMVSRNASPEVIRAAFKSLSQKYHPDRNSHPDADRIMQQFNEAYSVLSNPVERNKYDKQLSNHEQKFNENHQERNYRQFRDEMPSSTSKQRNNVVVINIPDSISFNKIKVSIIDFLFKAKPIFIKIFKFIFYTVILITLISIFFTYVNDTYIENAAEDFSDAQREVQNAAQELSDSEADPYISDTTESLSNYNNETQQVSSTSYKTHASNGELYPSSAGYVAGYPQLNNNGASILTVDNSQNTEAIFGKLYYLDELQDSAVRHFYIQGGGGLNLRNISPGYYDVRYKELENGYISKSEPFIIEEYEDYDGVRFSEITMTLYKVSNGNMQTYSIPESEF